MQRWMIVPLLFSLAATTASAGELALTVEEPAGVERARWPVTSGVPLAAGALRDHRASALFDAGGAEVPLQTEPLALWPDGSVRWLLLDFQIDLAAGEKRQLKLRYGPEVRRAAVEKPVLVERRPDGKVTIETGPLRLQYDPERFFPQGEAWLKAGSGGLEADRRITVNCSSDGVALWTEKDGRPQPHSPIASPAEITIEQSGPVRVCIRASGRHGPADSPMFGYVARIHAWRGQPFIRVFYTFINDHQDDLMARIRKLELRFWVHPIGIDGARAPGETLLGGERAREGRLLQVDESRYLLDGQPAGKRARGWAAAATEHGGMAVGLRHFWQSWPKAISCIPGCVRLELCPELPQGCYDGKPLEEESKLYYALRGGQYTFKIGVAKTHELCVNYFSGAPDAKRLETFFQATEEPLLAAADPAHVSATGALGDFPPADPEKYAGYDEWLGRALEDHLALRDRSREYGLLNFGDWHGERKVNWGNLEYDLAHGMFIQYLRTGDRRYFSRGEQAARHHIDVDVVHATNPHLKNPWGAPPRVGEIWLHCVGHTGGYYENAPLPVDRTYQMGHSTNFGHVWVGGDFEYYYLTGDRRARDVAVEIADAMVRHCPTAYGDHIRALGWPIILVLNAYDATGDKRYLDAATACWEVLKKNIDWERGWVVRLAKGHCLHPERTCYGNVPFMEGLTVSALARYHRVTQDPEVLRAMTAGIDQMIRECWVEEDKAFRYTACPLSSRRTYIGMCLA
ncbi:MAG: hypothetical protein JXA90_02480, partial [Planctomycetes bacterium]|nr:hypothetical protein [Planctomycetota bacterium]